MYFHSSEVQYMAQCLLFFFSSFISITKPMEEDLWWQKLSPLDMWFQSSL